MLVRLDVSDGRRARDDLLSVLVVHERLLIEVDNHVHGSQVLNLLVQVSDALRAYPVIRGAVWSDHRITGHDDKIKL